MSRGLRWVIALLCLGVIVAAIYLPILRRRLKLSAKLQQQTAEQARRELTQPVPVSPADTRVKAKMFWASTNGDGSLAETVVELPLSNDPVLRAKQVLNTLLAGPVDVESRTLPPDAALLSFYILPNGTAVADFSEALATAIPSGIQSEQLAVDSITRTLDANVPRVLRLKILIHGQEVETLAGHLDLTGTFQVNTQVTGLSTSPVLPSPAASAPAAAPLLSSPTTPTAPGNSSAPASKPATAPDKPVAGPEKSVSPPAAPKPNPSTPPPSTLPKSSLTK